MTGEEGNLQNLTLFQTKKKMLFTRQGLESTFVNLKLCLQPLKHISLCRFGHLEKVQVVLDGHSGRSRGFAFVYFESVDDATEARNKMTGTDLDGK